MPFVRLVGDPDPVQLNQAKVEAEIAAGLYTKEDVWTYNATERYIVWKGSTVRILGPDEGLSKFYQWGPQFGSYDVFVSDADWKRIQTLPEARHFALAVER